ncbi:MAG TPA: serine/threonine-protein kinase [Kofleriaceae bacterium]|nr:serine/threonine-protein kinase [Kofleriaceae bacterium]
MVVDPGTSIALRRGLVIAGRYRIEDVIGRGGMAVVASAFDLECSRQVALKIPHHALGRDAARFVSEARVVQRLTSRHVARLYEAGTFVQRGLEVPYLALEYIDGVSLASWLRAQGKVAPADAAAIVLQACDALAEAHALGVVHRDIKPANLMLTSEAGHLLVKVLDFGIARSTEECDPRLTVTGDLVGTPTYMAPEQLRPAATIDARSDVWALGVVLFEAITGRVPFPSTSMPELCLAILLDDAPPLPAACPSGIAEVVQRCLVKDPTARFASAAELATALRGIASPWVAMSPVDLDLAELEASAHSVEGLDEEPLAAPRPSRSRTKPGLYVVLAALVALFASHAPATVSQPPGTIIEEAHRAPALPAETPAPAPPPSRASTTAVRPVPPHEARRIRFHKRVRTSPPPPDRHGPSAPPAEPPPVPAPARTRDPLASPF